VAKSNCVTTDSFVSGYPLLSLFFIWYYSGNKMLSTTSEEKNPQDLQMHEGLKSLT